MQEKIKTMCQFAIRGKKYSIGESVLLHSKKVKIALVATDASITSQKKYINKLSYLNIPYMIYGTKSELGSLLNKSEISLFGIEDVNLAKKVKELVKEGN